MPARISSKPRYSAWRLFREGLTGQSGWRPAWTPRRRAPRYDAVIIGGGGHGLSTAYHLAKRHGFTSVAVLEKGWIGGGNTGRNTTVVRSNYYYPQSVRLYDLSVQLYEQLSKELNYNVMFSQRGMLELVHGKGDLEIALRIANAMRVNGIDGTVIGRAEIARMAPALDMDFNRRWPVVAALLQPRAGVARHDAVAWGYARAADSLGVHIIENCEVTGFQISGNQVRGVETTLGPIATEKVGVAVAGHSSVLAAMAGFELPLQSYTLQAMVSEPLKPCLDTVVASFGIGTYVSQSDKGELVIGGGLDRAPSYAQRGNLPMTRTVLAGILEMFPAFSNLKLMRQWGGIVDVAPDSSPILGPSPVGGLYLNCGWGTGGFKAIPAGGYLLAHIMATGRHHDISEPFDLNRFAKGELIDEAAGAGIAH